MDDSKSLPTTLEEVTLRKDILRKELRMQKQTMATLSQELLAPFAPAAAKGNAIVRTFQTSMAIFDGAILGLKLIRKFKHVFRKKRY